MTVLMGSRAMVSGVEIGRMGASSSMVGVQEVRHNAKEAQGIREAATAEEDRVETLALSQRAERHRCIQDIVIGLALVTSCQSQLNLFVVQSTH